MASLLPEIPLEYMNPARKYALINYLVGLGLPGRISAQVLREWAQSLNVELNATDYDLVYLGYQLTKPLPPGQAV